MLQKGSRILLALVLFASLAGGAWAQGSETFTNYPETGSSYKNGSYTGDNGVTWTYTQCRGDQNITGDAICLGKGRSPNAEFYSSSVSGGCDSLSLKYEKTFSTNTNADVYVNSTLVGNLSTGSSGVQNFSVSSLGISGNVVIKIEQSNSSAGQITIDDISWTGYSTGPNLAVNPDTLEFNTYPNTTISGSQSYTVTGSNLTGNVTVTAPTKFEVSTDDTNFYGSRTLTPSGGAVNATIYVRYNPGGVDGPHTGNVSNSGGGATAQNVAVTGTTEAMPTLPFQESFETDGRGDRYETATEHDDGGGDYFYRGLISGFSGTSYSGGDGSNCYAGEDTDGDGPGECVVTLETIDIDGFTNIQLAMEAAADVNNEFEPSDYILLQASVDGGAWTDIGGFRGVSNYNTALKEDTNLDGSGDGTELGQTFQDFAWALGSTGSTLDVRVLFLMNSGGEAAAFDNIRVTGDGGDSTPPEVDSVSVTAARTVQVTFNELMGSGVTVAGNYSISGAGKGNLSTNPNSVSSAGGNTYSLTWTSGEMLNNNDITVTVSNVQDDAGNTISGAANSGTDSGGGIGTAPTAGNCSPVALDGSSPINVPYSASSDAGSGIAKVELWVRAPSGSWAYAQESAGGSAGSFNYSPGAGDGMYYFDLVAQDGAGNRSAQPSGSTGTGDGGTEYDNTDPTCQDINRADSNPTNATAVDFTVTFDEDVNGVSSSNFSLDAGGVSGSIGTVSGADQTWTVPVTGVSGNGTLSIDLSNISGITDDAGNTLGGTKTDGQTYTIDQADPSVTVASLTTNDTTPQLSGTVSDGGSGVSSLQVVVDGQTCTGVNIVGGNWTANVPSALSSGAYNVAATATDNAGNTGNDGTSNELTIDLGKPSRSSENPTAGSTVANLTSIDVTFDETVTGVETGDLTVNGSGATLSGGTGAGPYTFTFSQPADGTVNVSLVVGGIEDLAGNTIDVDNWTYDLNAANLTATLMSLVVSNGGDTAQSSVPFEIYFSEPVSGLASGDFSVTNCSVNSLSSGDDQNWSFNVVPSGSAVSISLPADKCVDAATGTKDNQASNVYTFTFDNVPPTVSDVNAPAYKKSGAITVSYGSAGDTGGSGLDDVELWAKKGSGSWSATGLTQTGATGSVDYTPSGDDTYYFGWVATDNAGNASATPSGNGDANTVFDSTDPDPGSMTALGDYTNANPITINYTGASDGLSGLNQVELWWKKGGSWNGPVDTSTTSDGSFSFTPSDGNGTYYFMLVAEDNAGNRSTAATGDGDDNVLFDNVNPGITFGSAPEYSNGGSIDVSYSGATDLGSGLAEVQLWYKKETGGSWTQAGTLATETGTFDFSPLDGDGTYYFDVVSVDNAGNESDAPSGNGSDSTILDTGAPVVSQVEVTGTRQIEVTFTEANTMGAGVDVQGNYTLSGAGKGTLTSNPDSVSDQGGNVYLLSWNTGEMKNNADITITVNSSVEDVAGNTMGTTLAGTHSGGGLMIAQPTVQTVAPAKGAIVASLPQVQVTFSEPVMGVANSSLEVASSPASSVTGSDEGPYTFSGYATPPNGTVNVNLIASGITDLAGNPVTADSWTYDKDATALTATLTSDDVVNGGYTNASPTSFTLEFSESVVTFNQSMIQLTNAIFSTGSLTGSADFWQFEVVPTEGVSATVQIPAGQAESDSVPGKMNQDSGAFTFNYDNSGPRALSVTPDTTGPTNADSIDFTIVFDEEVQNFNDAADLVISHNGTANSGVAVDTSDNITFTVTVSGITGNGNFNVKANTGSDVTDQAGNGLFSSATSADVTIANTAPQATIITPSTLGPTNADSINFAVTFSKEVVNFNDVADLDITHTGTAHSGVIIVSSGENEYSVTVQNITGTGQFTLAISTESDVEDSAGNGLESSVVSDAVAIDNDGPTIVSLDPSRGSTVANLTQVQVNFSEDVSGVTTQSLIINGKSSATLMTSPADSTYVFTVPNPEEGTVNMALLAGTIQDQAGNAFVQDNWTYTRDASALGVTLTAMNVTNNDKLATNTVQFQAVFTEAVTGFLASEISVSNGAVDQFNNDGSTTFTFVVTAATELTETVVQIPARVCEATAVAGKENLASNAFSFTWDETGPTATFEPVGSPRFTPVNPVVAFNEGVTGVSIEDFTLTRNGISVDLTGLTVTALTGKRHQVNLAGVTAPSGDYVLELVPAGSGIIDNAGNAIESGATTSWMTTQMAPVEETTWVLYE